jgi:gliding motility-associated-like protein
MVYRPNAGICGVMDTFTYQICNANGCDTANAFILISCDTTGSGGGNGGNGGGGGLSTLRPDAHDDVATVGRNGSVTLNLLLNDITNGVLIAPPSIVGNPRRGTAVWNGVMMVYRPNAGICGVMDTFTYQICNANGCDTANAVIAILCDTTALRPDARDDAASTRTNTTVSIAILSNDITNGTLIAAPSILRNPGLGRVIIRNDSVIYTPNTGICGATDTLTYRICNSNGCDTATVVITITCDTTGGGGGTLLRPDARDDAASTVLNTPVSIPVLSNDITNGTLTGPPSIVSNPRRGTAVLNGNNIVYTPNTGVCNTNDTLSYRICNSNGCDTANVVITISCDTGVVGVPRCVSDTTAPVILAVNAALIGRVSGDTITRSCGDELFFQLADVRVTDNCDTLPRLRLDSVITNGTCRIDGYIRFKRYTWTATDTRNNATTFTIIVKIADTEAPVIVNVPNDVVLNRRDPIPATPTNVVATDNCDPNPVLTFRQTIDTVGTDTIYNRIWTATDACGNTTTRKWVITKRGRTVCGGTVNRLPITLAQSDCSIAASYCMPLPPATLQNDYEIRVDGQRYLGALTACDSTNSSTRLMFVTGRHIVEFYNVADDCRDTVQINVICNGSVPIETIYNDICIGQRLPGCLSTLVRFRNQRVVYANNICAAAGGTVTSYEIDSNYCFNFRGLTRGRDTACFVICTDSGRCLQLQFVTTVTGACSGIDTIRIALPVGRTDTVCIARIPLGYSPTRPPVNYCQDTTSARLVIDPVRNCIAITGTRPGTSQACIRVCDSTGTRCDTTIIIISVNPGRGITPPIAMDDSGRTRKNIPIQLDLMANDSLGTLQSITLVSEPRNGIATLGNDPKRTLTYVPNRDFCGSLRPEIFSYRICDQGGCATANIKIVVMCDTLRIYNGFSPNNDGKNDIFVVDGIEDYPNTLVQVYNRWGNQVYNNPDYHNDWDGTFYGQQLPDGTYFYVVLLATGERFVGYLQIHR